MAKYRVSLQIETDTDPLTWNWDSDVVLSEPCLLLTSEKLDPSEESLYWSDLAELTHVTQVERFGFCTCEDGDAVYEDCPTACECGRTLSCAVCARCHECCTCEATL